MTLPNTPAEQAAPETPQIPEPRKAPEQEQAPEEPQAETKYVTAEQLDQAIASAVRNVKMADKQRAKQIKDQVAQIEKTLEASGISVTPEQKEKIQTQVAASYHDPDEEPEGEEPTLDQYPMAVQTTINMMADGGLEEADKEFLEFVQPVYDKVYKPKPGETPLPESALPLAAARAIEAKNARISQNKDKAQLRTPTGSGERPGEPPAKSAADYRRRVANERAR